MNRIQVTCTDYDGMGNQGRFPKPGNQKKKQGLISFIKKLILSERKTTAHKV
jgi:hypothetical protein